MADLSEDWSISHCLGEGAYGEVMLVVNRQTGDNVAMKVINLDKGDSSVKASVEKEVKIHKCLKHKHVIRCFGSRLQTHFYCIFLEYAPNGELFDRIDPDIGLPLELAQKYMSQLVSGVEYLHKCGIAHRDIKPENLLLDKNDNLKISDFGLATIFRYQGKERALEKRCGTLPYVAPEVLTRPYAAGPADIWSCGIVLVAMLAGELPWDEPSDKCPEYIAWKKNDYVNRAPWCKLSTPELSLVKSILHPVASSRPAPAQLALHRFLQPSTARPLRLSPSGKKEEKVTLSQQMPVPIDTVDRPLTSFSQPALQLEELLLSTQQIPSTQCVTSGDRLAKTVKGVMFLQKLVRRMTRFYLSLDLSQSLDQLTSVLDKLSFDWAKTSESMITVSLIDKRKMPLIFKGSLYIVDTDTTLVDFRLSRGDGIEFKRHFLSIRSLIKPYTKPPPGLSDSTHSALS